MTKRTAAPTNTLPVGTIIIGAPKVDHEVVVTYKGGARRIVATFPTEHQARTYASNIRRQHPNTEVRPVGSGEPVEAPGAVNPRTGFWGLS